MQKKWLIISLLFLLLVLPACGSSGGGGDSGRPVVRKDGKVETQTSVQQEQQLRPTFQSGFYEKNITNAIASVVGALQGIGRKANEETKKARRDFGYLEREYLDFRSQMDAEKGGSHENQR